MERGGEGGIGNKNDSNKIKGARTQHIAGGVCAVCVRVRVRVLVSVRACVRPCVRASLFRSMHHLSPPRTTPAITGSRSRWPASRPRKPARSAPA